MSRWPVLVFAMSCATLRDELAHAETGYDQARYENTLIWLDDLERSVGEMDPDMQTRFYFLRGMTSYRLGQRDDALHYLALAREVAGERGTSLRTEWRAQLEGTLEELTPVGPTWRARRSEDENADTEQADEPVGDQVFEGR